MSLFQGVKVDTNVFWQRFEQNANLPSVWSLPPLSSEILFSCLEKMRATLSESTEFSKNLRSDLKLILRENEIEESLNTLANFISSQQLHLKLRRELGTDFPFELKRISFREDHFECWFPKGALVHITPNNSPLLNVLAMIEGLLSGSVNLLKLARKDTEFAEIFFEKLCSFDSTGELAKYIYIHRVSSKNPDQLKKFLSVATVVSAWGNEESLAAIKSLAPDHAEVVEWGHKISLSYISKSKFTDEDLLNSLATEICLNEQMSCSSPQVIYLETDSAQSLRNWAKKFAAHLDMVSVKIGQNKLDPQESAEISIQSEQVRLSEVLDEALLIQSVRGDWRIFVEDNPGLRASPLFRSVWVKPLLRDQILPVLSPMKKYLQTVGLAANNKEHIELLPLFYQTGFLRVNPIGRMTDSYMGEPHDGNYALQKFCKRVSFTDNFQMQGFASLEMKAKRDMNKRNSL